SVGDRPPSIDDGDAVRMRLGPASEDRVERLVAPVPRARVTLDQRRGQASLERRHVYWPPRITAATDLQATACIAQAVFRFERNAPRLARRLARTRSAAL